MQTAVRARLDSLTSLRFLAALVVVFSHSSRDLVSVPVLSAIASGGSVGVGFFFALSGFVLTWSHRAGDSPARFYRRRFARVYPLHFLTYLLAFPVLLLAGTNMGASSINVGTAIASPLLVQAWFPQPNVHYGMNAPSWSLSNEAFFYLLFPLFLPLLLRFSRRTLHVLLVALPVVVLVGAVVWSIATGPQGYDLLYLNPGWRLLGFLAGAVLARCVQDGMRVRVPLRYALGVAALGFLVLSVIPRVAAAVGLPSLAAPGVFDALMLPLFLLLIASAASADIRGAERWIAHPQLIKLGEWSFALYLTHWLLIDLVVGLLPRVRGLSAAPALIANLGVVVVAVAVSAFFYQMVERPLERRLRGARPRPEELPRAEPAR